jgi:hypothetical protein
MDADGARLQLSQAPPPAAGMIPIPRHNCPQRGGQGGPSDRRLGPCLAQPVSTG